MATFKQLESGKWQAQIAKGGKRTSKSFSTKKAAKDLAANQEYLAVNAGPVLSTLTVTEVFDRYARRLSPQRKGEKWEVIRLNKIGRDKIGKIVISELRPTDIADWRDRRLLEVANASVAREMNLISSVMTVARKEWGYLTSNPVTDVRSPKKPVARDRVVSVEEFEALALSAGSNLTNKTARVFHAFRFAMETAMRASEIVRMRWGDMDLERRVIHVPFTKNGHARDVPMSLEAVRLVQVLPHADPVFDTTSISADALWRKLRDRAGVEGLHFHDSRRNATTMLASKLSVLDLAKPTGHQLRYLQ